MRILYAIHTWHPEGRGGTEMHAHSVARVLARQGHQIGVFTRTGRRDRPEYEITTEWEGPTSVTRINNNYLEAPTYEWIYKNRRVHEAFERELDEFKPDLVHIHHLTGLSTTIIESIKARDLPLVMTLHDFWTVCPRGQRMTKDLNLCETVDRNACYTCLGGLWPQIFGDRESERTIVDLRGNLSPALLAEWDRHMSYVLNLCDLLICPSAFHRERMLDFPLDPARVIALPHGLDHGPFDGRLRSAARPVRIGFIGSVIPVKGVHVLIEAFKLLNRRDLSLEIHGEAAPFHDVRDYGQRLKQLAGNLPNVRFHGAYDASRIGAILDGIDILVVPSLWWETFCLTIREGQLAGIPVVASDIGAIREALDGERDGILFRVGDPEDLADKLRQLLEDNGFRDRFYNRGASVKSMEQYADEINGVYAQAIKLARKRSGHLVVAPPSFPSKTPGSGARPAAIPWEKIDVETRQRGAVQVSVATRLPTGERPDMTVHVRLREGSRDLGAFDVNVDLKALVGESDSESAAPAPAPVRGRRPAPAPTPASAPASAAAAAPASAAAPIPAPAPNPRVGPLTDPPGRADAPARSHPPAGPGVTPRKPRPAARIHRKPVDPNPATTRQDIRPGAVRTERWKPSTRPSTKVERLRPDDVSEPS